MLPLLPIQVEFDGSNFVSFPLLDKQPFTTSVYLWASFPNGTIYEKNVNASEAIIITQDNGSSGLWQDSGLRWDGSPDMMTYTVTINTDDVKGSFQMKSVC